VLQEADRGQDRHLLVGHHPCTPPK
jgi:hypothetical protein